MEISHYLGHHRGSFFLENGPCHNILVRYTRIVSWHCKQKIGVDLTLKFDFNYIFLHLMIYISNLKFSLRQMVHVNDKFTTPLRDSQNQ
jgi:hypothetical protein